MTDEQREIIKARMTSGYIVSRDSGIGLVDALNLAEEDGAKVYERLGNSTGVGIDHSDRMLAALKRARHAMTNDRYLKPRIGMESECAECDDVIAEVEAYNAAVLAVLSRHDQPTPRTNQ